MTSKDYVISLGTVTYKVDKATYGDFLTYVAGDCAYIRLLDYFLENSVPENPLRLAQKIMQFMEPVEGNWLITVLCLADSGNHYSSETLRKSYDEETARNARNLSAFKD